MTWLGWLNDARALDVRQPWGWPSAYQYASFGVAVCVGVLFGAPWWFQALQAWSDVSALEAQLQDQRQAIRSLRQQTTALQTSQAKPWPAAMDARALATLPAARELQFSHLSLSPSLPTPALTALQLQQQSIQLSFQGSWNGLLSWWSAWPQAAAGVTVSTLTLKAHSQGGIEGQLVVLAPQRSSALDGVRATHAVRLAMDDPFDTQQWQGVQRAHAEKHPSYAVRVAPELFRARDPLEVFPRDRLHYVGSISAGGDVQALLRVVPPNAKLQAESMTSVHRIRLGEHMGQDFGRVVSIAPDHLLVQELVLEPGGDWVHRHVRLDLQERTP